MASSISDRIASLVKSLIEKKPRNYIKVLESYKRLLRLEVEKRTRDDRNRDASSTRKQARQIVVESETQIRQRPDDAISS